MRPAVVGVLAVLVLVGGSLMGVAALLVLPLAGIIATIAIIVWFAGRRAQHKPPMR